MGHSAADQDERTVMYRGPRRRGRRGRAIPPPPLPVGAQPSGPMEELPGPATPPSGSSPRRRPSLPPPFPPEIDSRPTTIWDERPESWPAPGPTPRRQPQEVAAPAWEPEPQEVAAPAWEPEPREIAAPAWEPEPPRHPIAPPIAPPRARRSPWRESSRRRRPELLPHQVARVLDAVRGVAAQRDLADADAALCREVAELTASERVHCLFRDPQSGALWSLEEGVLPRPSDHPGLTTFAARTGSSVASACASDARLYRAELDDPDGDGRERLVVQPVTSAGVVIAVIAAVRRAPAPPYTPIERLAIELVAEQVGPILQYFTVEHRLDPSAADEPRMFGPAADAGWSGAPQTDPLRSSPRWTRWAYAILLAAAAGGLLFTALSTKDRTSAGPAVVRFDGVLVTAPGEGTVAAVSVTPGARVRAGDLLVELGSDREAAEVAALQTEYEARMAGFLQNPSAEPARRSLADAVARLDRARTGLASRGARAPRDGLIGEVRVRPGMRITAGDPLVTLVDEAAPPAVVALLPGSDRAALAAGMELHVRLGEAAAVRGVIEEVGRDVIDPTEARRLLGDGGRDAGLGGPVVLVRARLPRTDTLTGLPFRDGMVGTGEVEIRSRRTLSALIPGGDG